MKTKLATLMKIVCILFMLTMSVGSGVNPSLAQEDADRPSATDTLPTPLPLTCSGSPVPSVCVYGYVYHDGLPVLGANLHIDSEYGDLDTVTAIGGASSDPYYYINLSAPPLLVSAGDVITFTTVYNGHTTIRSYQVDPGAQQMDFVFVLSVFGDGSEGELNVGSGQLFYLDDVRTSLVGLTVSGQNVLQVVNSLIFSPGDAVFIHQTRGTNAGTWEIGEVINVAGGSLAILNNILYSYNDGGSDQSQVVKINQYSNCTINIGGTLSSHAWDSDTGGIVPLMCSGFAIVSGIISAMGNNGSESWPGQGGSGIGYRGGSGAMGNNYQYALTGEGIVGDRLPSRNPNGNGGGGGYTGPPNGQASGGGGGYSTGGQDGQWIWGAGQVGLGGNITGIEDLSTMVFGGGGGGGSTDNTGTTGGGGGGGGIIFLGISTLDLSIGGTLNANGGNGGRGDYGAGGGGAGGSIFIRAKTATVGNGQVTTLGGQGGAYATGGYGGLGRIRIEYVGLLTGTTNPPASVVQRDFSKFPIITINYIYPNPAEQDQDMIIFRGSAVDNDDVNTPVTKYVWRSDLDGVLSTQANFSLPASNLSEGVHTIYFKARDDEGKWSEEISRTVTVNAPSIRYIFLPNIIQRNVDYFQGTWEVEPNNSWDQANGPLRSSIDYHGYPNDQKDYFSIYTFSAGNIIIDLTDHTGTDVQLQLFYNSIDNRVAYDPSPPYHINYPGQPGWYYIYIYTGTGFNTSNSYTLNVDYP